MAANPIHTNSVTTDSDGILSQWVVLSQCSPQENNGSVDFTEVLKGPYSNGRSILSNIKVGDTLSNAHTALGEINSCYDTPACPTRNGKTGTWKVKTIDCLQNESGSHCILTITYEANYFTTEEWGLVDDPYQNTWSISWQSYTVSPYAFCANPETPTNKQVGEEEDTGQLEASRSTIQLYLSQNGKDNVFKYKNSDQYWWRLNQSEQLILKKINTDTQAIYHYPVVTHNTTRRGAFNEDATFSDKLGQDLDMLSSNLPSDCPYDVPGIVVGGKTHEWEWLKIADDIEQVNTKTNTSFTRKESWMGVISADINYYGSREFNRSDLEKCRWMKGML